MGCNCRKKKAAARAPQAPDPNRVTQPPTIQRPNPRAAAALANAQPAEPPVDQPATA